LDGIKTRLVPEFSRLVALCAGQSALPKKINAKTMTQTAPRRLSASTKKCRVEFKCYQPIFPIFGFKQIRIAANAPPTGIEK
jgi:hypothetical protein